MRYDPDRPADAAQWLRLDEQERMAAVRAYHRRAKVKLPNEELHAVFHVIVEDQLAMQLQHVVDASTRLQAEGLTRHDCIHAIASVLSGELFDLLKAETPWSGDADEHYARGLAALTAKSWLASIEDE